MTTHSVLSVSQSPHKVGQQVGSSDYTRLYSLVERLMKEYGSFPEVVCELSRAHDKLTYMSEGARDCACEDVYKREPSCVLSDEALSTVRSSKDAAVDFFDGLVIELSRKQVRCYACDEHRRRCSSVFEKRKVLIEAFLRAAELLRAKTSAHRPTLLPCQ